jgi:hypothetical protein
MEGFSRSRVEILSLIPKKVFRQNLFILFFCICSLSCLADKGGPVPVSRLSSISVTQILQDSVPQNKAVPENDGAEEKKTAEKKDAAIKEVPKARKQVKPLALDQVPKTVNPVIKPVVKPIIKPVIKSVVKPVIKPAIRIH